MSKCKRFRLLDDEDGQAMVESAFVFMLLVTIVLGLIDFAFIFEDYIGVVNAANVGATYGATSWTAAQNTTAISNAALSESNRWHCSSMSVSSSTSTDTYGYAMVSVTVECQVADLIPIPGVLSSLRLSNTAVRRVR